MAVEAGLQVDYLPLAAQDSARWDGVLGVATFAVSPSPRLAANDVPVADIRTPVLGSRDDDALDSLARAPLPGDEGKITKSIQKASIARMRRSDRSKLVGFCT